MDELPNFPCEIYFCRKRKVSERGERGRDGGNGEPGPFSRGLLNEAQRKFSVSGSALPRLMLG